MTCLQPTPFFSFQDEKAVKPQQIKAALEKKEKVKDSGSGGPEKSATPSQKRRRSSSNSSASSGSVKRGRRSRSRDSEEEEQRRKLERKLREKEEAYQQRLSKWEQRESRKRKDYEKEKEKQRQRRREELKEAKKLKEFFEDYDDERDDAKYYKGSAYNQRRKDYDKERELDAKDRLKEKEEMDELKRQLMAQGKANPEEEIQRIQREQEEALLKKLRAESSPSEPPSSPSSSSSSSGSGSSDSDSDDEKGSRKDRAGEAKDGDAVKFQPIPGETDNQKIKIGFGGLKLDRTRSEGSSLSRIFGKDVEETEEVRPSRRLVPLEYTEEERLAVVQPLTADEKKKQIKQLIETIPTAKAELFNFSVDWAYVDANLVERRLKPWVTKKIVEYIGEEEPNLVEFICEKVGQKSTPQTILEDISTILDDEAEVFVVKMWRLLIYEIEAKKKGLIRPDGTE